ncbi:hypothetical protein [Streptomyces melanogenes]|uniref:Uncharacterized protein n=1 Tax=Streptomyces melanogenes TaxID=67326 RepID=A0ABZ1XI31_9ACTN|nr:hypothetical protein [Streptomyces melanogenes]
MSAWLYSVVSDGRAGRVFGHAVVPSAVDDPLFFPGRRCPGPRSMTGRIDGLDRCPTVEGASGNGTRIDVHLPLRRQ